MYPSPSPPSSFSLGCPLSSSSSSIIIIIWENKIISASQPLLTDSQTCYGLLNGLVAIIVRKLYHVDFIKMLPPGFIQKKLEGTHILLVIVVLLALLVGHDDTDTQRVEHRVVTVGVGWETDGAVSLHAQNYMNNSYLQCNFFR